MKKRIGSLLLSLALCLSMTPTAAFAEVTQPEEPLPQEQTEQAEPTPEGSEDSEQSQQDEDIITVQELIDALPDASALDEMAEEALERACLAASEAYDAYDALTEEQQSALTGADNMLAILEWATQQVAPLTDDADPAEHTHDGWIEIATGYGNKVQKSDVEWTTTTQTSGEEYYVLDSGNYYLKNDISLGNPIRIAENATVTLCLNGKTITGGIDKAAIIVATGATLNLTDCTDGGKITHETGQKGRGVYVNGTFNMYGGSITGNSTTTPYNAGSKGGGVYVNGSSAAFNMYGGSITGNTATQDGGGVYVENGKFKMTAGTIGGTATGEANTAQYGGGVYVLDSNPGTVPTCTFDMTDGSITGNQASEKGGGVFVGKRSTFNMTGGTIGGTGENAANTATKYGGGVAVVGTFNISGDAAITGNKINEGSGIGGGGVYVSYEEASGYTVYGKFTMSGNARITANTATKYGSGGGVYMTGKPGSTGTDTCTFTMTGGTIGGTGENDGNKADYGGGVSVLSGKFTMSGGSIAGNTASIGGGVAMYAISGNDVPAPTFTMSGSASITGNKATSFSGGGVYVNGTNYQFIMEGGTIGGTATGDANTAKYGGGVSVLSGKFTMSGGSIAGNTASIGGGVAVVGTFNMSGDAAITGNRSTKQGGGVYVGDKGTFTMSGTAGIANNIGDTGAVNESDLRGGGGVYVANGGTFNMTDGSITGNQAIGCYNNDTNYRGNGGGVLVDGTFNMTGGSITGNTAKSSNTGGGGVCVCGNGKFNMSGTASIAENTAAREGGGVYVYNAGTFNMSGGSITGNTATNGYGGGVCVRSMKFTMSNNAGITGNHAKDGGGGVFVASNGSITVSGAVNITGNSKGGTKGEGNVYTGSTTDNLYLIARTVAIGKDGLTDGAKIGVGLSSSYIVKAFTDGWSTSMSGKTPSDFFSSDAEGYAPVLDASDGELHLAQHTHNWTYALDTTTTAYDTITATCSNCPLATEGSTTNGSITIKAPAVSEGQTLTYDGNTKEATVENSVEGLTAPNITYKQGDTELSKAPTNAGTYTASITLGDVTASVTYEITKATPTASDFTYTAPSPLTYDGNAKTATAAAKNSGMGDVTVKYFKNNVETEPKDAGKYTVKIDVTEGTNYNATTSDLTDPSWEFTIQKADQAITAPSGKTIVKNGIAVDITGWANVTTGDGSLSYTLETPSAEGVTLIDGKLTVDASVEKGISITIKVTAAATDNYNEKTETFTVKVLDKATATVTISGLPATVAYGQEFTLTASQTDDTAAGGQWSWDFDREYFQRVESNANTGMIKLQAIKAGTPGKVVTINYESDTHKGNGSVTVSEIAKKILTKDDLNGIPDKLTKVYDGGTGYTYPDSTAIALTLKDNVQVLDSDRNMQIGISADQINFAQSNAGTTTAKITLNVLPDQWNYKFADDLKTIDVPASITPKAITIASAAATNRAYANGDKNVDVAVTFNGLVNNETLNKDIDYMALGSMDNDTAGENKNVAVTVMLKNDNYSLSEPKAATTVNISKSSAPALSAAPITQRWNDTAEKAIDVSWIGVPADAGNKTFSATVEAIPDGISMDALSMNPATGKLTYTLTGATATHAGQKIVLSVKLSSENYNDATAELEIQIIARNSQTISFDNSAVTKTYGDEDFTVKASGAATAITYASSDESVATVDNDGKVHILKAGKTTITAMASETVDYDGASAKYELTVNKKSVDAPAADDTKFVYNGKAQTYKLAANDAYTITGDTQQKAGEYKVTVDLKDKNNVQWSDGTTEAKEYDFVIIKQIIEAPAAGLNEFVYNGADQTYELAANDAYTISGNVQKTVGDYKATVTLKDKENTQWKDGSVDDKEYSFTIKKLIVTVPEADTAVYTYDGTEKTYNLAENAAYTIAGNKQTTANEDGYTVTVTLNDPANTQWSDNTTDAKSYTFVIRKKSVEAPAADDTKFVYNGADQKYKLTANDAYDITGDTQQKAGEYKVKVDLKDKNNVQWSDKTTEAKEYDFIIAKQTVNVPEEDKTNFVYTGKEQTYKLAENAAYSITGNKQTAANEDGHTVTVSLNDKENTQWSDGGDADKTFKFVIKKAAVTITVNDKSAYTGDKAPDLSKPEQDKDYAVSGLIGTDALMTAPTLAYDPAAPDMSKAGEAAIKASGADAGGNYAVTYVDGKLTITTRRSSGGGSSAPTYTVTAPTKTENGTVTASVKNAKQGDKVTITVTPEKDKKLDSLTVTDKDGNKIELTDLGNGKYTFVMPAGNVTIASNFIEEAPTVPVEKNDQFIDVKSGDYFYDAVTWAVEKGITSGVSATTFAPNAPCTRAQIVTFLWRAAGSPEPKSASRFSDVSADSYYAKAVAWAVENGITGGTGSGKFSPDETCTREQAAAFLYRASGSPAVSGGSSFSDVADNAYYAKAVAWAEKNGITGGIGGGRFGSGNDCTRGQIVTFLYRSYMNK